MREGEARIQGDEQESEVALRRRQRETAENEALAALVADRVLEGLAGAPRGFLDKGAFIWVRWQSGVVGQDGPNGVQVEDVIGLALRRLGDLQRDLPCEENRVALRCLQLAVDALGSRTRHRRTQGVEATMAAHDTPQEWLAVGRPLLDYLSRVSLSGLALPKGS